MKRTLVLVKHAEPVLGQSVDSNRWRLSERGRSGSVLLGGHLARYGPGVVVSSKEPKAVETAGIAAGRLGIGSLVRPELHEHDRTGAPFLDDAEFGRTARDFFERPYELAWGNETARQAGSRFEGAVRRVLEVREEGVVVIVAHGTVISLLVARYNDLDAYALWRSLGLPSSCVLSAEDLRLQETVPNLRA